MTSLVRLLTVPRKLRHTKRSWQRIILSLTVLACLTMTSGDAAALPQGLSLSLAPTIDYVIWDRQLGLSDVSLYGGRLSLNFGRIVSLQGHYLTNSKADTDLGSIRFDGEPVSFDRNQELRINRYGADLLFNLGLSQSFVPFLRFGGGVMQFQPAASTNFDVIALSAGGGLRVALLERLQAQLYVEDLMFRVDRGMLVRDESPMQPGLGVDPERTDIRHNMVFGGNIILNLGGHPTDKETELDRAIRSRYDGGLFGGSWTIEPFGGKVNFDSDAALDDQPFAGVRTGLNFGQLIGLRGYYWRGMNDKFDDTEPVQSYGGEAQFHLNSGQGAIPYLVVGAGQLDFLKKYLDEGGAVRSDKTMLIVGGGLGFTLGRHFRVNAGARDYIFTESESDALTEPGELLHNWAFSAGLTFLIGGKQSSKADVDAFGRELWTPEPAPGRQNDIYPYHERGMWRDSLGMYHSSGMSHGLTRGRATEYLAFPDSQRGALSFQSDRVVAIPVPEVGEIYIRYGEPGGVKITSENYPQPVQVTPAPDGVPPVTPALIDDERLELLSRRLEERLGDRLEKRIDERLKNLAPSTGGTVVITPPATDTDAGSEGSVTARTADRRALHTYVGVNVDEPAQLILGARLDAGAIANNRCLRFVPELAFGLFNSGSFMIAGNAQYDFGWIPGTDRIAPYVFAGLGLIRFGDGVSRDRTEGVLNIGYGITKPVGRWSGFLEHQAVDLFSLNRINVGIRWDTH